MERRGDHVSDRNKFQLVHLDRIHVSIYNRSYLSILKLFLFCFSRNEYIFLNSDLQTLS